MQERALSPDQWSEADAIARRLVGELAGLVARLPEHARGASGMSRALGIMRATCQRVVAALSDSTPTATTLAKLPGVEGLEQFISAAATNLGDASAAASARLALGQFAGLIERAGGSHAKLAARLALSQGVTGDASTRSLERAREDLYRAAARVTGRRCDTWIVIYMIRDNPENPEMLDHIAIKGAIGHSTVPGGMPLMLAAGVAGSAELAQETDLHLPGGAPAAGRTPEAILRPFTTDPLPIVTTRNSQGVVTHVIDPAGESAARPVDVVSAIIGRTPNRDPVTRRPNFDSFWNMISCPTRRLLVDVYLHETLERRLRLSTDVQQWHLNLNQPPEDRWITRYPGAAPLTMLGRGLSLAATDAYARHAELSAYAFERVAKWDPRSFVGFRLDVAFPIFRAGYCIHTEEVRPGESDPAGEGGTEGRA